MSTFWILFSIISSLALAGGTYVYLKRWKFVFVLGKALIKSTMEKSQLSNIGTSIKHIDDLIIINNDNGVIILPYKRLHAYKAVNSQVWLISNGERKKLKVYPGYDFKLSPQQIKCDRIEVHRDGEISSFEGNEVFDWGVI